MTFFGSENFWLYLPLAAWVSGIFYFASDRNSASQTAPFFIPLLDALLPRAGANALRTGHAVIRKFGHLATYAVLALLASAVFYNSSFVAAARFWHLCAFAVVASVASADEFIQSFYPSRVGSLADVALDCIGGLAAIFAFWIFTLNRF